ncbi:UNVERIFIED_CONTAM: Retrovirus-related Pol polyprotein from transposon opus [Sesamum latifolium]|uniref:Retrovirus-related Pol polyprotein from transposon opus n=1 Tax=Sesamum latifolium TaxID=2727402 RepID=A0AAW2U2B1_9LAMI
MDASQGYHQIMLNPDDQKRVSFITSGGTYYYVMPFELINAGATYQRLVDRMFKEQLGRNMEVYVDDMLVKSRQTNQHLADLAVTFDTLRKYHMKLNPAKCAFSVRSGKFLGYLVTEKGIEVNPEKIRAIQEMKPPTNLNEVQRLAGCIAALNRFISRSTERILPFFKALKKTKDFAWDEECQ